MKKRRVQYPKHDGSENPSCLGHLKLKITTIPARPEPGSHTPALAWRVAGKR